MYHLSTLKYVIKILEEFNAEVTNDRAKILKFIGEAKVLFDGIGDDVAVLGRNNFILE